MTDMPRKLPLFVTRERSRHGRLAFYFRRGKGERTRLPDYGSATFDAEYQAALAGTTAKTRRGRIVNRSSLAWLVEEYRVSADYAALSPATRRQRDNIFHNTVEGDAGGQPFRAVSEAGLKKAVEIRKATPSAARNFLDAMRGMFRWAKESGHVTIDPTTGLKPPKRRKNAGFTPWTDDDVALYEARWPAGSKERVWLHVLRYTGLRRGDAVTVGRQHVKDGVALIRTEKSGYEIEAVVPLHPQLIETLAIGPTGDLAWICGERGRPFKKESFGTVFREACDDAGIAKGKSAHGLRKLAAATLAELGLTVSELEALFGWEGGRMASHYTKSADRRALGRKAALKMLSQGAGRAQNNR